MSGTAAHEQTIPEALSCWAARTPDAIALLAPGREPTTYRELLNAVDRLAAGLRSHGLGRGDGIALVFPEGPELCLSLLAAISVGVAVPLAWPAPEDEYSPVLANSLLRAVLVSGAIPSPKAAPTKHGLPVITLTTASSGRIGDFRIDGPVLGAPAPAALPAAADIAVILHSSGATGGPKCVPRTHRNVAAACKVMIEARAKSSADRCLSLARTVYSQGFNALMYTIFSGASQVTVPGPDIGALPLWLQMYRPTYISTTPAVLLTLITDRGEIRDAFRRYPPRTVHSTAGPLSPDALRRLEETLGVPILNGYGMTEASGIAGERYPEFHRVPGSVGIPWCEVRIVDEHGESTGPNEAGEIVVRGPTVFSGYLDDPGANAAALLPDSWFRTGDLGFLDGAGYLHLTGRLREIINRGGEKIAPDDVDRVLKRHPAVAEAAAFGVPDARLGEDIVAAVVLKPGMSASVRELRRWLSVRLSPHKIPRRIWLVERLPRTRTGKVQRGELAERFIATAGDREEQMTPARGWFTTLSAHRAPSDPA